MELGKEFSAKIFQNCYQAELRKARQSDDLTKCGIVLFLQCFICLSASKKTKQKFHSSLRITLYMYMLVQFHLEGRKLNTWLVTRDAELESSCVFMKKKFSQAVDLKIEACFVHLFCRVSAKRVSWEAGNCHHSKLYQSEYHS